VYGHARACGWRNAREPQVHVSLAGMSKSASAGIIKLALGRRTLHRVWEIQGSVDVTSPWNRCCQRKLLPNYSNCKTPGRRGVLRRFRTMEVNWSISGSSGMSPRRAFLTHRSETHGKCGGILKGTCSPDDQDSPGDHEFARTSFVRQRMSHHIAWLLHGAALLSLSEIARGTRSRGPLALPFSLPIKP
jgi:hypothetical protein